MEYLERESRENDTETAQKEAEWRRRVFLEGKKALKFTEKEKKNEFGTK